MGNRLTKIYTRTGDQGQTGLGDGSRLSKDSVRVEALGAVDELNSLIGLVLVETLPEGIRLLLQGIQHELFDLGSELAVPGYQVLEPKQVDYLEQCLDQLNRSLPPLKEFILPGGNRVAALTHVARTVCRRAERRVVRLLIQESERLDMPVKEPQNTLLIVYLNRLSDLLFVIARTLNYDPIAGINQEVLWQSKRQQP